MASTITNYACPRGHASTEADYCSECGAKIQGATADPSEPQRMANASGDVCPDCGTLREQSDVVFCEVCGYNFVTGAHGEIPVLQAAAANPVEDKAHNAAGDPAVDPAAPESAPAPAPALHWTAMVSVDPSLRRPESPEAPTGFTPYAVTLDRVTTLIGRRNEARGISPEIDLSHDEAVSRRHALLQVDPQRGLLLRDIGAANGTRLNGKDLDPMIDTPLRDGDEITLGHWSRLRVQGSEA